MFLPDVHLQESEFVRAYTLLRNSLDTASTFESHARRSDSLHATDQICQHDLLWMSSWILSPIWLDEIPWQALAFAPEQISEVFHSLEPL